MLNFMGIYNMKVTNEYFVEEQPSTKLFLEIELQGLFYHKPNTGAFDIPKALFVKSSPMYATNISTLETVTFAQDDICTSVEGGVSTEVTRTSTPACFKNLQLRSSFYYDGDIYRKVRNTKALKLETLTLVDFCRTTHVKEVVGDLDVKVKITTPQPIEKV